MAAPSELLKALLAKFPELARLATLKTDLWAAMRSKGLNVDDPNMDTWAAKAYLLRMSLDAIINANGYTHNFGTDAEPLSLSKALTEQVNYRSVLAETDAYSANQFREDSTLLFLNSKPFASSNIDYFCAYAANLAYVPPDLDFSNARRLYYTFWGCKFNFMEPIYDTYTVDFSNVTQLQYSPLGFTKHLIIENMPDTCTLIYQSISTNNTSIDGLNLSGIEVYPWPNLSYGIGSLRTLTHIGFKEGSIIRYADVIYSTSSKPSAPITYNFDVETLYGMCVHAYDWATNPRGLTWADYHTNSGNKETHYLDYFFSDTNKADLEAAYPDVDFTTLMTSKGWNY